MSKSKGYVVWLAVAMALMPMAACVDGDNRHPTQAVETTEGGMQWVLEAEKYMDRVPLPTTTDDQSVSRISFRAEDAIMDGLSPEQVDFLQRLVNHTNDVLDAKQVGKDVPPPDQETQAFFEWYTTFNEVQSGNEELSGDLQVIQQPLHCGGGPGWPATCEPTVHAPETWSSRQEVVNDLLMRGFHKTHHWRATQDDYTLSVAWPCGNGVYRFQALIEQRGERWSYRHQHDLNPELHTFWWPHKWWPSYVLWWHISYCN